MSQVHAGAASADTLGSTSPLTRPAAAEASSAEALPIHVFALDGKWHAFDPESGRFFRTDQVGAEILRQDGRSGAVPDRDRLVAKYGAGAVDGAIAEIRRWTAAGALARQAAAKTEKPVPTEVKPRLVSLTLNVTASCNLRCTYCWNNGGAYGRTVVEKKMTERTALAAVDLLVRHSAEKDDLLVDFYGGEPLLNFPVLKATMDYCSSLSPDCGRSFSYKVTTNGTLLTPEMIAYFGERGVALGVSIDGVKQVHDRNRPLASGAATWKSILKNVGPALRAGNLHVSARATLAPPDIDMVKATKGLFREGFSDTEVEFASEPCEVFRSDGLASYTAAEIGAMKHQYVRFARFYLKYALYADKAIDTGLSNNLTRVLYQTRRFSPCGAGSNFVTVAENGDLYPCIGFMGMENYRLGDVWTGFDLERLKELRCDLRSVVHVAPECGGCWARNICAGNCPAHNEQYNKDLYKPYANGCDWLKFQLEVAMWVASEIRVRDATRLEGYKPV
jgi:uncharacterized protein